MKMNKLKLFIFIDFIASVIFTLTCLSFHLDKAVFAFPLALIFNGILFYIVFSKFLKSENKNFLSAVVKLLQYQPFVHLIAFIFCRAGEYGTLFAVDVVSVFAWCIGFISNLVVLHMLSPKRISKINPKFVKTTENAVVYKKYSLKWLCFELLDWIDALVQAVFMVLLFQIFILQFYVIPSESMVPELLIHDRLVVSKFLSGPKFPLSEIGIPYARTYNRGDIVVFRNPHYSMDRKSEVKSVVSQLVYMLTLTFVNLNVDDNGRPKADPLVKRVVGLPGEQLVMQDGILYSRTASSSEFTEVGEDKLWASYNLSEERASIRSRIQEYPVTKKNYETLLSVESERNQLDMEQVKKECRSIVSKLSSVTGMKIGTAYDPGFISGYGLWEVNLFEDNYNLTRRIISSTEGISYFNAFMTDWINSYESLENEKTDPYTEASLRLNVMTKLVIGKLILRNAELMLNKVPSNSWSSDEELKNLIAQGNRLHVYYYYQDRRNMPVFPANAQDGKPVYIPENCYFMMGDNRFNSLDMRHSYDEVIVKVTDIDRFSVMYLSNMEPQYVERTKILGTAKYRFWPYDRIGKIGHSAR